jgi:hypothetical protein
MEKKTQEPPKNQTKKTDKQSSLPKTIIDYRRPPQEDKKLGELLIGED